MRWKRGIREFHFLDMAGGLKVWWASFEPNEKRGKDGLYFEGRRFVKACCRQLSAEERTDIFNDMLETPYGKTARVITGIHLFPAVEFPAFYELFTSLVEVGDALAKRIKLEFGNVASGATMYGFTGALEQEDKDKEEEDENKEHAALISRYNFRVREQGRVPKKDKKKRKGYGLSSDEPHSVYADSLEEQQADAVRLVNLIEQEERDGNGNDDGEFVEDVDLFDDDEEEDGKEIEQLSGIPGAPQKRRRSARLHDDLNVRQGPLFPGLELPEDPIHIDGDEDEQQQQQQEDDDVHTETARLGQVHQIVMINTAALKAQLELATYLRAHFTVARDADLRRAEEHALELSRSLHKWTPMDRATAVEKTYTVIEDADGTEVRMSDCANELGINWSAVSNATRKAVAELSRDLHKEVYGAYPKKKRMPSGNGKMQAIYFYNRTTYVPTMKEAMTRLVLAQQQ